MTKEYYTVEEFSEILRVTPQTIRSSIRKGRICVVRVGIGKKAPYRIPHHQLGKLYVLTNEEIEEENKNE